MVVHKKPSESSTRVTDAMTTRAVGGPKLWGCVAVSERTAGGAGRKLCATRSGASATTPIGRRRAAGGRRRAVSAAGGAGP